MEKTDIVIAGSGLNGTSLALALAQAGLRITLIDPIPETTRKVPQFDGRAYALALASKRLLSAINIWDSVSDHAQPMMEIKVTDGRAGEGAAPWMLHFDQTELEEGPMGYMVEDRFLRMALLSALDQHPNVTQLSGVSVTDQTVHSSCIAVRLSDGSDVVSGILIGCDGRGSPTAQRAGIRRTEWGYDQAGVVCAVEHDRPHGGIAHQFFMPSGPLAILPLPGNRCSIVWSERTNRATELMKMEDGDFLTALRPAFGSFLGDIQLAGARFSYPLGLTIAQRFIADRIALVGDAAHGVHPIAGQGLNAGLRDVAALFDVLSQARQRGEDIASPLVLKRYEEWRRFDTATLAIATDGFNRLFSNDNPILRTVRDLGMGAVNAMPPLRRNFMREAAGLTGDLPSLMKR